MRKLTRFFIDSVLPKHDHKARLNLQPALSWQPWLHPAIMLGSILTLVFGDRDMIPPINGWDWVWLTAGIISPPLGFWSIWLMKHHTGRVRYRAFWLRLAANAGAVTTMSAYEVARFSVELSDPIEYHPLVDTVFLAAILFMVVVIYRDLKFLVLVERLAAVIYRDVRALTIAEKLTELAADDHR